MLMPTASAPATCLLRLSAGAEAHRRAALLRGCTGRASMLAHGRAKPCFHPQTARRRHQAQTVIPCASSVSSILCRCLALHQKSIPGKSMVSFAHRRFGSSMASPSEFMKEALFVPPGVTKEEVTVGMVLPGSNIVVGHYIDDAQIKQAEFVKSSTRAKDCPKDNRPEFAIIGRSNVGKSSLINALVCKKEFALTSKKPGKTQLINHFLINKSWYIVDLPGYGFAHASESARMDWSSFTKGYFLNRDTLVAVLLLVDASIPPQQIDLDCANWLGRNNIGMTFVFTKCDKTKGGKGCRPADNIKQFQDLIRANYREPPPWIMTSSITGLGRDELLLHMSQLRNYWDTEAA